MTSFLFSAETLLQLSLLAAFSILQTLSTTAPFIPSVELGDDIVREQINPRLLYRALGVMKYFGLLLAATALYLSYGGSNAGVMARWHLDEYIALLIAVGAFGLRVWSMISLKRFFTFEVAIRQGHQLVQNGPYRLLMHPSYTGFLFAELGQMAFILLLSRRFVAARLALAVPMWIVAAVVVGRACTILAWLWKRIEIEEAALRAHFGVKWSNYAAHRWRLIPFIW